MRKEQVLLEHDADRSPFGRGTHAGHGVLEHDTIEHHVRSVGADEPGDGAQERGLARPIRTQQRHDLARTGVEGGVEVERAQAQLDVGLQHQDVGR